MGKGGGGGGGGGVQQDQMNNGLPRIPPCKTRHTRKNIQTDSRDE